MAEPIGNPLSWSVDAMKGAGRHASSVAGSVAGDDALVPPRIRRIDFEDIRTALRKGAEDFAACRSDVAFLCLLYPVVGATLAWLALQRDLLPLIFPLISGFALVGPVAGVGLYELSRRRERGMPTNWGDAFAVTRSPSFGAILVLAVCFAVIFTVWIMTANAIYAATLGPAGPYSLGEFVRAVLTTGPGWAMTVIGIGVGFLFAVVVLAMSLVSFPMLLDRNVGVRVAVTTSMRVTKENPVTVAAWGAIVAVGLALGSLPVFLGLIVVLPVLGHATWHLYRRAVVVPGRVGD